MDKDIENTLQDINDRLEVINQDMDAAERVWAAELADRQRLGLTGDAAIKHYNDWMDRHGMGYLKVPYLS